MLNGMRSGIVIALGFLVLAVAAANQATIAVNLIPYYSQMVNPYTISGWFVTEKTLGFDVSTCSNYAWNCVGAGAPAVGEVSTAAMCGIAATQIAWGMVVIVCFLVALATVFPGVRQWVVSEPARVWGLVVFPLAVLMVAAAQMVLQGLSQVVTWAANPRNPSDGGGTEPCSTSEKKIDGGEYIYPCETSKPLTVFPYDLFSTIWRLSEAPGNTYNGQEGIAPCSPSATSSCNNYNDMWTVDVICSCVIGVLCVVVVAIMIHQVNEHRKTPGDPAVLWFVEPIPETFAQTRVVTGRDARGNEVAACFKDVNSPLGGTVCDDKGSGLII